MKNKLIVILVSISIFFGITVPSFADENSPTVIVKSLAASKYLAFGSGGMLDKDPALQTLLLVTYPNGFNFSLWNSTNFKKWNSTLGSEVDYSVGWSGEIGGGLSANIGVIYFDEPDVFTLGAGDIVYPQVTISRKFGESRVSIGVENYTVMPHSGFKGGNLYSIGASRNASLTENLSVGNSLTLVYDDGGFGYDNGLLLRGSLTLDWKLSDRMTLILPQINYYVPLTTHDNRGNDAVFFGGLAHRF
jgi:hypothetical protein